jgi:predicted SnoaL-like aldol condensation-catalyzing enzyme
MTDQDVMDIAGLIHAKWVDAFETLERANAERPDGSPDWAAFNIVRIDNAIAAEAHWSALKQRYTNEHREQLNRAFGI